MKKILIFMLVVKCIFISAQEQEIINLTPLGEDLTTLFSGIGQDVIPLLHQNSISGDIYGEAEIDEVILPFYISIPSISISTTDGIATVLGDETQEWKLEIAKLPNLVNQALADDETQNYYDLTQRIFALPTLKMGLGFKLPKGFELHLSGIYLPPIDFSSFVPELGSLTLDIVDVGVKVRKTIFPDKGFRPAFSIGAHYFYSTFILDYTFESLTDIMDERLNIEGFGDLDLGGNFRVDTSVQSFGLDFHLSKRLLFLTPFVKLSPTVYYSAMSTNANLDATLYGEGTDVSSTQTKLKSGGQVDGNGLALFASTGLEIRLFFFAIHLSVTADLQNPILEIGNAASMEFNETAVDKVALNIGFRFHF